MSAADAITAFSALVAAISFLYGVRAWKREFVGKRQIELAELTLSKFFEAADAIQAIRSPFGYSEEGKTRQRMENESPTQTQLLDRAHVVFERYDRRAEVFAEIRSLKYRFMAAFGKESGKPFDDLNSTINEVFISARMLGDVLWPRQSRPMSDTDLERHLEQLREHEANFWITSRSEDRITSRVNDIVEEVARYLQSAVDMRQRWWFNRKRQ